MAWTDDMTTLAEAVSDPITGFGQAVVLPSGQSTVGVFERFSPRAAEDGVGLTMRIDQQPNPTLRLVSDDASGLATGDKVTVDGSDWTVTRSPEPDGFGMTTVYLMPASTDDLADEFRRWR
jgi:hypothetical protein